MTDLHANAQRVEDALVAALGDSAQGRVVTLADSARTAADAATALGCDVGAIVKSLVFVADGSPVLMLTSGAHQVDTGAVATLLGVEAVRRADADIVRQVTGFPIGGVAPIGHPAPIGTLVDLALQRYDTVWAAAGTPHTVFSTTYDELLELTDGTPAEIGQRPTA